MNKKLRMYIGIIGIVVLIIIIIFFSCRSQKNEINDIPVSTQNIEITKIIGPFVAEPVFDSKNNKILMQYAENENSPLEFNKYNLDNASKEIFYKPDKQGAYNINYSPDKSKMFLQTKLADEKTNKIINLTNNETYTLDKNINNIFFTKNNKIVYTYYNESHDAQFLDIADIDGKNWSEYIDNSKIPFREFKLYSDSKGEAFVLLDLPHAFDDLGGFVYIDRDKQLKQIGQGKYIIDLKFSPDGRKILLGTQDPLDSLKPNLYVYDLDQHKEIDLGIASFVSKATWIDEDQIAIGIPDYLPENYSDFTNYETKDKIYLYGINEKKLTLFKVDSQETFKNISHLFVDKNNNIYFLSDFVLYKINQ